MKRQHSYAPKKKRLKKYTNTSNDGGTGVSIREASRPLVRRIPIGVVQQRMAEVVGMIAIVIVRPPTRRHKSSPIVKVVVDDEMRRVENPQVECTK